MVTYADRKDPTIARLIQATFPSYRGAKVQVTTGETYTPENYWSGGSKTYAVALSLETSAVSQLNRATENPMNNAAHVTVPIPQGVAIVEHVIFDGKDSGIRIIVHPENLAPFLPAPNALTERQLSILATVRSYISSYRKEVFALNRVTQAEKDELQRLGYLTKQGGLTLDGKNAASNATVWQS